MQLFALQDTIENMYFKKSKNEKIIHIHVKY